MSEQCILIVEDQEDSGEIVAGLLDHHGFTSEIASNAEVGLDLLRRKEYTAAIIDLALPGMDGIQMIQRIRALPALEHLPCIACTAYHSSKVRRDTLDAGFDAYLAKPIGLANLMQALDDVLPHSDD